MAITPTTNWGNIQRRAVDPYSLYTSENINFLNAITGKDRARIYGLTCEYLYDVPSGQLVIHLSPGICIKDYVLISFNEDIYVNVGSWPVTSGIYVIVLEYKFETKYPPNIARIKVIKENDYDADNHFALYRLTISGITYPDSLFLETIEELTNFDRSAEELFTLLQDHMHNTQAHRNIYYTKSEIDNMLVNIVIDPENLASMLENIIASMLPFNIDAEGDIIISAGGAPA